MKKLNKNQVGFGTVGAVLVLTVAALIAGVGFMVYKNNQKTTKASVTPSIAAQPTTNATPAKTSVAQTNFEIKEWGIKAQNKSQLTLKYALSSDKKIAYFTSDQLVSADSSPGCGIGTSSDGASVTNQHFGGGFITRYLPTDKIQVDPNPNVAQVTPAEFVKTYDKTVYTKLDEYYYIYSPNQGPCGPHTDLWQQTESAVSTLLKTFQTMSS